MRYPVLATLAALAGCHTSYLAHAGDAHRDAGRPSHALANYEAALREEVPASATAERSDIQRRMGLAADAFTVDEVEAHRAKTSAGDAEAAFRALVSLRAQAKGWSASQGAHGRIVGAMAEAADRLWPDMDKDVVPVRFPDAVARAEWLTSPFDAGHPMTQRLAKTRGKAAAWHVAEAAKVSALPAAALAHFRFARRYGASPDDAAAAEAVRRDTEIQWDVAPGGSCGAEARAIAALFSKATGRPVRVALTVGTCTPHEKRWNTSESYTYQEQVAYTEYVTQKDTSRCTRTTSNCKTGQRQYPRYDSYTKTTTVTYETYTYGCDTTEHCPDVTVPVTRYRTETRSATRKVQHLELGYDLGGTASVTWDDRTESVAIQASKRAVDTSHSSPHGNKSFGAGMTLSAVRAQALAAAQARVAAVAATIQASRGQEALARGDRAAASGNEAEALSAYFLASRHTGTVAASADAWMKPRFGAGGEILKLALDGRAPPVAPIPSVAIPLPPPDAVALEKLHLLAPVHDRSERSGTGVYRDSGVEIGTAFRKSPFDYVDWVGAVRAVGRAALEKETFIQILGEVEAPLLSDESSGFTLGVGYGMAAALGHGAREPAFAFDMGLVYAQQSPLAGPVYRNFALSMRFVFPLWTIASLDMEWLPNLVALGKLSTEDGDDRYWSPFSTGLTLYLGNRVFARCGLTWWYGSPEGIHLYAEGGVRF